jgi:hypothetical protein
MSTIVQLIGSSERAVGSSTARDQQIAGTSKIRASARSDDIAAWLLREAGDGSKLRVRRLSPPALGKRGGKFLLGQTAEHARPRARSSHRRQARSCVVNSSSSPIPRYPA